MGLHLNNEMMNLIIQWFGYYMLLLATILLLPARLLLVAGTVFIIPECWIRTRLDKLSPSGGNLLLLTAGTTLLTIIAFAIFAFLTQIPGIVLAAGLLVLLILLLVAVVVLFGWTKSSTVLTMTTLASVLGMTCAVAQSCMQFDYHALRGRTLMNVGRIGEAIQHLEEAGLYPASSKQASAETNTNLAIGYVKLLTQEAPEKAADRAKQIERLFRQAMAEDPRQFVAYYSFGNFLVTQERFVEAEQMFRGAISIKPDYSHAYFNLGSLYERTNRINEAIQCYDSAAKIEPYAIDIQQAISGARAKLKAAGAP